jgi:hypothetical protein
MERCNQIRAFETLICLGNLNIMPTARPETISTSRRSGTDIPFRRSRPSLKRQKLSVSFAPPTVFRVRLSASRWKTWTPSHAVVFRTTPTGAGTQKKALKKPTAIIHFSEKSVRPAGSQ